MTVSLPSIAGNCCNDADRSTKITGELSLTKPSPIALAFDQSAQAIKAAIDAATLDLERLHNARDRSGNHISTSIVARTALSIRIYRLASLYNSLSSATSGAGVRAIERPSVSDGSSPNRTL